MLLVEPLLRHAQAHATYRTRVHAKYETQHLVIHRTSYLVLSGGCVGIHGQKLRDKNVQLGLLIVLC